MNLTATASAFALTGLLLASCATSSVNVDPIHVPDSTYAGMSCEALTQELRLAHLRVEMLTNSQDAVARSDARTAVWAGVFIQGDRSGNVGALGMAKGQRDALIRVSTSKRCGEAGATG